MYSYTSPNMNMGIKKKKKPYSKALSLLTAVTDTLLTLTFEILVNIVFIEEHY